MQLAMWTKSKPLPVHTTTSLTRLKIIFNFSDVLLLNVVALYIYIMGKKARLCDLQQQSSMIRFISIFTETITHAMQFGNSTIKIVKL